MTVAEYPWGTTRPQLRLKQLEREKQSNLEQKAHAAQAFEALMAYIDGRNAEIDAQICYIRNATQNGSYDRTIAKSLPIDIFGDRTATRRPGRPSSPIGKPRPCRKSRAKIRITANVAAGAARGIAPCLIRRFASHVGAAGPGSEMSRIREDIPSELVSNDHCPVRDDHPKFVSSSSGEAAIAAEQADREKRLAVERRLAEFEAGADVTGQKVDRSSAFTMPYDFSDPCDPLKMPAELASLYPLVNEVSSLPTYANIEDLPFDEFKRWWKISHYSNVADDVLEREMAVQIRICRGERNVIRTFDSLIRDPISEESDRRHVWHYVHVRISRVNLLMNELANGWSYEDVLDEIAQDDYMVEGDLNRQRRLHYIKILDRLRWPQGFSRYELIVRAMPQYDLALLFRYEELLDYSSYVGPAKNIPDWRRLKNPRPHNVEEALAELRQRIPPAL